LYAKNNVGEKYYHSVCQWLKLIMKIPTGDKVALQMIAHYTVEYKRRPKMMELLRKIK
jgi:hypothetical protein